MILHKKKIEPAIILQLQNEAGKTIKVKIPIDDLRYQLKEVRKAGKDCFSLTCEGYETTIYVAQAEEVIFKMTLAEIQSRLQIPKILGQVLCFEYDRNSLIYNEPIQGRELEVKKLRTFLTAERKSNCIMVGDNGVGRTTIVKDFVRYLYFEETDEKLKDVVVLRVDLGQIPDGKIKKELFYKKLRRFLRENRERIVLHFDSFEGLSNYLDMWNIFYDSVAYWNLRVIGEITMQSLIGLFTVNTHSFTNLLPVEEFELEEMQGIIKSHVKQLQRVSGISISEKMVRFAIMTGSSMATATIVNPQLTLEILNFAVINAKINAQDSVEKKNILAFYNLNQKLMESTEQVDKLIVAYHEIGHYVVALKSELIKCSKNAYVSTMPIGDSLGTTVSYEIIGKKLSRDRSHYAWEIAMFFAGRLSESFFINTTSTGASADIEEANRIAREVVLSGGLATDKKLSYKSFTGEASTYLLTEEEKENLNNEIDKLLEDGFKKAKKICKKNADLIRWLVFNLLKDEILLGTELEELVAQFEADPEGCKALIPDYINKNS